MPEIDIIALGGIVIGLGSVIIAQNHRMWKKICGLINIAYQKHAKEANEQDL